MSFSTFDVGLQSLHPPSSGGGTEDGRRIVLVPAAPSVSLPMVSHLPFPGRCDGRVGVKDVLGSMTLLSPSRPRGRPSSPRWTLPPRPIPFGIPSVGFEAPNPPDGIPVCSSNRPVRRGSEKGNASVGFERRHFAHVEHDDAELQGARCFAKEARKEDGFVREVMPEGGGGGRAC